MGVCRCALLQLAADLLQYGASRLSAEAPLRDYTLPNSRENVELLNEIERRLCSGASFTFALESRHLYVLDTILMGYLADRLRERCSCTSEG